MQKDHLRRGEMYRFYLFYLLKKKKRIAVIVTEEDGRIIVDDRIVPFVSMTKMDMKRCRSMKTIST